MNGNNLAIIHLLYSTGRLLLIKQENHGTREESWKGVDVIFNVLLSNMSNFLRLKMSPAIHLPINWLQIIHLVWRPGDQLRNPSSVKKFFYPQPFQLFVLRRTFTIGSSENHPMHAFPKCNFLDGWDCYRSSAGFQERWYTPHVPPSMRTRPFLV